uniref:Uncharacterized protein n=1 Tax=Anguilla anguilla TaxID=7936 RepID=A0A0E9SVC9_ANGAN
MGRSHSTRFRNRLCPCITPTALDCATRQRK